MQRRYKCKACGKVQLSVYQKQAFNDTRINIWVTSLVKEGCGICSMSRLLKVSSNTVMNRIKQIAKGVNKPTIVVKQDAIEVDEVKTFIGRKQNEYWVAYALNRQSHNVIDLVTGKRTKGTLKVLTDTLLLAQVKKIYTDKLKIYRQLIPKDIHRRGSSQINHIERNNLNLRTHLKRLSRRTICYSRSAAMLNACLRIYFWHKLKNDIEIQKTITHLNEKTKEWEVVGNNILKLGETIKVTLSIETPRSLRYVFINDRKSAGLEPSAYKSGYMRGSDFSYYESTRDAGRQFFAEFIPAGKTQIVYDMIVSQEGRFFSGMASLQCMYRPETTAYCTSQTLDIGN